MSTQYESEYEANKGRSPAELLRLEAERHRAKEIAVDQERQNTGVPSSFSTGVDKKPLHQQDSLADIVREAIAQGRSE